MPVLFPEICRAMLAKQLPDRIESSYIELEKAFMAFVKSVPEGLKVFFMVDGVDAIMSSQNCCLMPRSRIRSKYCCQADLFQPAFRHSLVALRCVCRTLPTMMSRIMSRIN